MIRTMYVQVYSAHEYTESNAKFAAHVNPNNKALKQREQQVHELRSKVGGLRSQPTLTRLVAYTFRQCLGSRVSTFASPCSLGTCTELKFD